MIKVYSNTKIVGIQTIEWREFEDWLNAQLEVQFDIETNVTPYWCIKELKTMQFGSTTTNLQYVLDVEKVTPEQYSVIRTYLESWTTLKVIHDAAFEYIVMRFHDIEIHNVFCTMVAEKVLQEGAEVADYSLQDLAYKYLDVKLDKTLQTSFGDGELNTDKVIYAAQDVKYLQQIKAIQEIAIQERNHTNTIWLEMKSLLAFSDCTYYGVLLDVPKWTENVQLAEPVIQEAEKKLNDWLIEDIKLYSKALELGYVSKQDKVDLKLNSPKVRLELFKLAFPNITGTSLTILKKYQSEYSNTLSVDLNIILCDVIAKSYDSFIKYCLDNYMSYLVDKGLVVLANTITINWNSQAQVLPLLQAVEPRIDSMSKEALETCSHPIVIDYKEYKDSLKLTTSFGLKFIEKHLEPDGCIRTNYNQVVSTGRCSSVKPNMQQIPSKEYLKNRYRNSFICESGWKFVDSDFSSQELVLIAYMSKDPVWLKAVTAGHDLHSVTAAMVYGKRWENGTEDNCAYAQSKQKCDCKQHKTMRNAVKAINFGLCYGMSEFKLAATLKILVKDAQTLIQYYFKAFPAIKGLLKTLGLIGVTKGYSQTIAPINRMRTYPAWESLKSEIQFHVTGIQFSKGLGRIERQSKNHPIQGSAADMLKLAIWKVYLYLRKENLTDKVHLILNVHDQIVTLAKEDFAEQWAKELDRLMKEAALLLVPSGILKAETTITNVWHK